MAATYVGIFIGNIDHKMLVYGQLQVTKFCLLYIVLHKSIQIIRCIELSIDYTVIPLSIDVFIEDLHCHSFFSISIRLRRRYRVL